MADKVKPDAGSAYSRRAVVLGAVQIAGLGAVAARLHQMQIVDADRYSTLSDENRINTLLVPPPRGKIYDRFGRLLASNRDNLKIVVVPEDADDLEALLDEVSDIAPLEEKDRQNVLRRARRQRAFVPVTVKEHLSWAQFARINVQGPGLRGVRPEAGYTRQYHHGRDLSHILGYVGPVSDWERADDPLLLIPGYEIGKAGIEKVRDDALRGRPGIRHVEVNAGGRVIRELDRTASVAGDDMVLSVDLELQKFTLERLAGETAACVVMDVRTGEVLALASAPAFDANLFVNGLTPKDWRALARDPGKPLMNRAVQGQYPPGSTFKMVVALAALESGLVKPHESVRCTGRYFMGKASYGCWKRSGHGHMNMHNAIRMSCDYYFYEIANRIGIERIAEMAVKLGLGTAYAEEFMNAQPGTVPTPGWKQATLGEIWYPGETPIAAIGQGYVLATPLQLAVYAARIANGGKAVRPTLVRYVGADLTLDEQATDLGIAPESLAIVHEAMDAVVNGGGTAARSRLELEDVRMAGKTGTSQVRTNSAALQAAIAANGGVVPRRYQDHALFVAYAPADDPRYAVSVIVEHGGGGSKAAAPVAKDVMTRVLELEEEGRAAFVPSAPPARTAEEAGQVRDG